MSALEQPEAATPAPAAGRNGNREADREIPARIFLQPIAAPSVLGLFGFAGATLIVAAWMAGWYGVRTTPDYLFPFAALVGGLAQFLAGMWAFRARDTLATAFHGTWGAFWMGYGVLYALAAAGTLALPTGSFPALGFWYVALAAITGACAAAALAEGLGLFSLLTTLTTGSVLAAVAFTTGSGTTETVAGYFLVVAAVLAWYVATAMLLAASYGRVILPLGRYTRAENLPGGRPTYVVELAHGEPGLKHGQ
jgi:succinate-acetate transporter protein